MPAWGCCQRRGTARTTEVRRRQGSGTCFRGYDGEVGCLAAVGCFGNGIVADLAHFSYKSNNFCAERRQPPLLLDEPPLTIAVDHATNDWAGAADGMESRAVSVAVRDCDYHGETVAEGESRGQWGRVSVGPGAPAYPSRASGRGEAHRPCTGFLPSQELGRWRRASTEVLCRVPRRPGGITGTRAGRASPLSVLLREECTVVRTLGVGEVHHAA